MSFLSRFLGRERRDVAASDPYLAEYFGLKGTTGYGVSPTEVESNLAVAARCISLRSETMASVGLHLYRRTENGGRMRADDSPLYAVLHDIANGRMSAFELREFLIRQLDTFGNAFARIERNARGQVVALWPEPWGNVGVERLASGRLRYRVSFPNGGSAVLLDDEVLHVRGPSRDGIIGLSPIQIARGAFGLALDQKRTADSLMENALRPSGLLSFPDKLGKDAREAMRTAVQASHGGSGNAGRLMILDGGAKFDAITFTPADAEFLETRKLSALDVARVYGCPPTTVGITDNATYSNVEGESTALVRNALGPLAARIEQAMMRCLLSEQARRSLYIEHDLSALLRGDVQARFEAYRIGREIGALSPNDVRRRENEPPVPGGDVYHQPANWVPLGTVAQNGGA
ncbi:phage portal protein [Oryzibacter oryziterrae]|uniref:phage portal protein n=1 Tax=Oryzibacter oryziterrae TaxID=2766474 RepID=UPI001F003EA0|nr:phage portal protein [Oryzibacter oryziterrae]